MKRKTIINLEVKKTFDSVVIDYLVSCKNNNLAQNTTENYKRMLEEFSLLTDVNFVADINNQTIEDFKCQLLRRNVLTPSTINLKLRTVRIFINWCKQRGLIDKEPNFSLLKEKRKVKNVLTNEQLNIILKLPSKPTYGQIQTWYACHVLTFCWCRSSTLEHLKESDINLMDKTIRLYDAKIREFYTIPMHVKLIEATNIFLSVKDYNNGFMFQNLQTGEPAKGRTITNFINDYFKKLKINESSHAFRRTGISNALNNGVDSMLIAKISNHKNLQTIYKHYYKTEIESLRDIIQKSYQ
jgi:integrase/recombinase XerD